MNGTSAFRPRDYAATVNRPAGHFQPDVKGSSTAGNNRALAAPPAAVGSRIHRGNGFAVLAGLGSHE